jgi:hypothetical protein
MESNHHALCLRVKSLFYIRNIYTMVRRRKLALISAPLASSGPTIVSWLNVKYN